MNWEEVAFYCLVSRHMEDLERKKRIRMSFSSAGHELVQVMVALMMTHPKDAAAVYYRSRAFAIASGVDIASLFAASLGKSGYPSGGRDASMVYHLPEGMGRNIILPTAGDVGSQFPKAMGWAHSAVYHMDVLGDTSWKGAVAVAMGGDGSVASNGFWAALNVATTLKLPVLFVVEDNRWGIGVPSDLQVPGGNIAQNLRSYGNLRVHDSPGYIPEAVLSTLKEAFSHVRSGLGPALVRFRVARLAGHSSTDDQSYRSEEELRSESEKDPLNYLSELVDLKGISERARGVVERAWEEALKRPYPDDPYKYVFFEGEKSRMGDLELTLKKESHPKMRMFMAIRKALDEALSEEKRVLVFGEDVGLKGGIYRITSGLQEKYGPDRVFDTSLNEVAIVARAESMAISGLRPVAEIQFRKYADEARQPIHNIGFLRWRTFNHFSAPVVLRIPVGFIGGISDPWHSFSAEQEFLHMFGWKVAYPSNACDAYSLLKQAIEMNDPVIFLEHRHLYFSKEAEAALEEHLPFGKGRLVKKGHKATVVSWGYTLHEVLKACSDLDVSVIDLRTLAPWDEDLVMSDVRYTGRLLVVHEDSLTCGFGAEVVSRVCQEVFPHLKAPPMRLAVRDIPIPFSQVLFKKAFPDAQKIRDLISKLVG